MILRRDVPVSGAPGGVHGWTSGLRYLIRPGPALVSLVGSSERRWEQVLSLCQGGKEGRLYMSPLAAREISGAPPGFHL